MNIKNLFEIDHWNLITDILTNGRYTTWYKLAVKHKIRTDGNRKQRSTSANDIWRRFMKVIERENLDLKVVKQTFNQAGEILYETRKKTWDNQELIPKDGFTVSKVTTNPYGGEYITYEKDREALLTGFLKAIDKITQEVRGREIFKRSIKFPENKTKRLAVVNLYDAHLDKISYVSDTGEESSVDNNSLLFLYTIARIAIKLSKEKIDKVIFPIGNDLFHTNNMDNKTKKGTEIEYYGSPEENYYIICNTIIESIVELASVCPEVEIIMVKGNHDEDKISVLGYWLDTVFKDIKGITVDYERKQRKYTKFGKNLIGFAHGDKEKNKIPQLPLLIATEAKELWGETVYRKMYLGDLHHGFEYQFLKAKDQPGVEVEYLRSVGITDSWHHDHGWIGIPKTAYLQIFDEEEGEIARYKYNIK